MLITIIIFFLALVIAFGMLAFRAWEIRTNRIKTPEPEEEVLPDLAFRHVEKSMLYLTKYMVQSIIVGSARYWFITMTKTKKFVSEKMPKIHDYFEKKAQSGGRPSFVRRAINESKVKIRRVKEKVKREHEDKKVI